MIPYTDILALDLATCTGYARGKPGELPQCGTVRFGEEDASANAVFAHALTWASKFLEPKPRPHAIIIESMLPPTALKGETSRATRDRLAGLHGIIRAVAYCRGIYTINEVSVLTVRKHFCGSQNSSKHSVYEKCRMLGWSVPDMNASDAAATWHFACSLIDPRIGIEVTPLFGKTGKVVSIWP